MDKRNSKESLLAEIDRLNKKINLVYREGIQGIFYVGRANYPERENEAIRRLESAFYEDKSTSEEEI